MLLLSFPCARFPAWASCGILGTVILNQTSDQTKSLPLTQRLPAARWTFLSPCYQGSAIFLEKKKNPAHCVVLCCLITGKKR